MENPNGLFVQGDITQAPSRWLQAFACRATVSHAARRTAVDRVHRHSTGPTRRLTPGADKGFDAAKFVTNLREACVTPQVAQKSRYSALDRCTTRKDGYAKSQRHRKRIEEAFGWAKAVGGMAQTVYPGSWARDNEGRRQAPTPLESISPSLNAGAHAEGEQFRLTGFFSRLIGVNAVFHGT